MKVEDERQSVFLKGQPHSILCGQEKELQGNPTAFLQPCRMHDGVEAVARCHTTGMKLAKSAILMDRDSREGKEHHHKRTGKEVLPGAR